MRWQKHGRCLCDVEVEFAGNDDRVSGNLSAINETEAMVDTSYQAGLKIPLAKVGAFHFSEKGSDAPTGELDSESTVIVVHLGFKSRLTLINPVITEDQKLTGYSRALGEVTLSMDSVTSIRRLDQPDVNL